MGTKSELKENILAAKLEGVTQWVLLNRGPVLVGAGVLVASLLLGSVFVLRNQERSAANLTRLAMAQSLIGQHQYDRAALVLHDLKGSVPVGLLQARVVYFQGIAALEMKKLPEAEAFFQEAADKSAGTPLRPLALANLGFSHEEKRDFAAAAQTYQRFMADYAEHFLAPRMQLALGRSLAMAGQIEEAKSALAHLTDLYPTSAWAQNARSIMDKLKTR